MGLMNVTAPLEKSIVRVRMHFSTLNYLWTRSVLSHSVKIDKINVVETIIAKMELHMEN